MHDLIPRDQAMELFHRTSSRLTRLLRTIQVPSEKRIPHMEWTVGELAAHLVQAAQIAGQLADGHPSPYERFEDIAETNERLLAEKPERDLPTLAREFQGAVEQLEVKFRALPDDVRVPFHGGWTFTPPEAMVMFSTEMLMHTWDLYITEGRPFEIDHGDAKLIIRVVASVMPNVVDQDAARGFSATYELRIRGGDCFRIHFDDGEASVSLVDPGGPADCRISADASTFLLMGYGRGSQIMPLLTGKVLAWGRKPWLGAKFTSLVKKP
jgi:uncharacterized protein (TIGR03083 family)